MDRHTKAALRADLWAEWWDRAACKGRGQLMADKAKVTEARRVCWSCDVLFDCRTWVLGLAHRDDSDDVTGALTPDERRHRRTSAAFRRTRESLTVAVVAHDGVGR